MFADPEWFTCIKDTIPRTKMQETRGLFLRDFFSMLSWQRILPFCRGLPRKGHFPAVTPLLRCR
ncbi:hypothetical protein FAEPRAM212_02544 [Faecalibacterium prausnitzii M21/2]|uniref:Uncharacterized protein n=1 Tax=Faecalibacterium prausnitzii M21/2 TaxID=411485 RepID=A8SET2_9FIRM|nr:hypothetical protein FAEPRAM212_02544 [Faecalibacterium prausnitzii M21/2]